MADKSKGEKPNVSANSVPDSAKKGGEVPAGKASDRTVGPLNANEPTGTNEVPAGDPGDAPGRNDPMQASGADQPLTGGQDKPDPFAPGATVGGAKQAGPLSGNKVGPAATIHKSQLPPGVTASDLGDSGSKLTPDQVVKLKEAGRQGRSPVPPTVGEKGSNEALTHARKGVEDAKDADTLEGRYGPGGSQGIKAGSGGDFPGEVRAFMRAVKDVDAGEATTIAGRILCMSGAMESGSAEPEMFVTLSPSVASGRDHKRAAREEAAKLADEFERFAGEETGRTTRFENPHQSRVGLSAGSQLGLASHSNTRAAGSVSPDDIAMIIDLVRRAIKWWRGRNG